jgi:cytochrome oxidase Cu insertion factor (SCO1/SenC/PrrC family)
MTRRFSTGPHRREKFDATFRDEHGRVVAPGRHVVSRPVLLGFVYYECPMLCTQVMNGLSSALEVMPFTAGDDFDLMRRRDLHPPVQGHP